MVSLPLLGHVAEKAEERFKRWTKPELVVENALLRQQLIVLEPQVKHPVFTSFD